MKKILLVAYMGLSSCTVSKPSIDNTAILQQHKRPFRVFAIGDWTKGYSVLTLVDDQKQYFVIKTAEDDHLKIGDQLP